MQYKIKIKYLHFNIFYDTKNKIVLGIKTSEPQKEMSAKTFNKM